MTETGGLVYRLPTGPQRPINESRRFAIMAIGAYGCICTSLRYAFNLTSGDLQSRYNLSGRDVSSISTVGLVFCYFVLPYAFIFDYFGPRPVFGIALVTFPVGALLLALTFAGYIEASVLRFCVFNAIFNIGCTLFDLGCMMTVMSYFPSHKGAVVAIMKSYIGLGSAIVGCIQVAFFLGKTEQYFYFLMALVFVVGGACLVFLRLPSYHLTGYEEKHLSAEEKERRLARKAVYLRQKPPTIRFGIGLGFVLVLIIFLPMQGALVAYKGLGQKYRIAFAAVVIALMVFYPTMALPLRSLERKETDCNSVSEPVDEPKKDNTEVTDVEKPEAVVETDLDYIAPQYQTTFFQNLRTPKMWALVWSYFCIVGSEFVIIFNARFIFAALSGEKVSDELGTLLTVLNGVGSAVGRLLMSYFEIWTQKRKAEDRIPITLSLFFPVTCVMLSMIFFLVLPKAALPLPYVLAAMGNGFCAAVIVLVARTIFAKDPAKHYNFCFLGTMFSVIFLNRLTYGEWYTSQAEKQGTTLCLGRSCVLMPLLFFLGLNCTALVSIVYVNWEYRRFSRLVLEERRRLRKEAPMREKLSSMDLNNAPDVLPEDPANGGNPLTEEANNNYYNSGGNQQATRL
ncbi:Major facilitator superfamily [Trypanosoma melophagium]|uniref:Major facilitator superfamily n=1 Tax=Trypanosoma melophagium TaxID=715481 RepID=UPI00351A5D8E|nr:Major facilitator superfamily [Trypanosoma melophagium]